ncbi:dihydrodipicolinate synthase/N-acetylneuraminate lyase [Streptomyces sp. SAI-144]|jgi:4-hydroxy-tetrahydrodipicolinate synthase|uniref:dihydrodipicolinate synthase family protein n=1 Tax=Streptomyces sp. SAI-144 TaxID=2940544 RepID=UPI002476123C|nr:dihydrodipicolinate synthase family protein [Streptomyces sp. SAI-144]MDH6436751.1 dihydrodipicolinate synthase/N-acetylneuraminate lyase [Streptomyces sp. SAI-144]
MIDPASRSSSRLLTGLSAFPLAPVIDDGNTGIDEAAFTNLITRLAAARVDAITVLGSTGSYTYLTSDERQHVVTLAAATGTT